MIEKKDYYTPASGDEWDRLDCKAGSGGGVDYESQSFTTTEEYTIYYVKLKLKKYQAGASPFNVSIRATTADNGNDIPTGSDLTSGSKQADTCTDGWHTINITPYVLSTATTYALVFSYPGGDTNVSVGLYFMDGSGTYAGGNRASSGNSGSTWSAVAADDIVFEIWGGEGAIDQGIAYGNLTHSLVAITDSEVYYESPAGTMITHAAASGAFNKAFNLSACAAFQKVFIANGTTKKIFDLQNTKITTGTLGSHPPNKDNILTGGTSTATMVTDYITALSGATTIYGRRTSATAFLDGETVTGTDDDGNAISFALNAAQTEPPHFYDWTVWGNSSTYGTMPSSVTLVKLCLNGRVMLAGDQNFPHQWYMLRQNNPYDFNYLANDAQSPISGDDADVAKFGDAITALIPLGHDYVALGGVNSMGLIEGDPAEGGSLINLTKATGITGSKAWCIGPGGDVFFLGTNGFYQFSISEGLQNLSQNSLPNLISDWAIDVGTHRIVLSYDKQRHGIIISKTAVADGTNLNYWYDLRTKGFCPEVYPEECALFSSHYYESDDADYRKLVLGCNDGYLRYFLDTAKDDDIGGSDEAISSYVVLGPIPMSKDSDREGKMINPSAYLAGGASGGAYGDSDQVTVSLYRADDAETLMEDIEDGATAFSTASLTGTGRKTIKTRMKGAWAAVKLSDSTATKTWGFEKFTTTVKEIGRIK